MIKSTWNNSTWFVAAVILILSLAQLGCEDEVNPFIGTDLPFTLWGQINPTADTQAVRVFAIDPVLDLIPPTSLDASVTIIELETGQRYPLSDSLISLPGDDYRHVFWSVFDVQYGNTYRLEVERSDGGFSRSEEIKVPSPIEITQVPPNDAAVRDIQIPVLISGNPPSIPRIDVTHLTQSINQDGAVIARNDVVISYTGKGEETPEGILLNIQLSDDFSTIREDYAGKELPNGLICSNGIRVDIHVGNESWRSPVEVFDPNVLVEPGTFSNIENGFGYFGAGFIQSAQWQILLTLLVRAGFNDCI